MKSVITKPRGVQDKETKHIVPGDLMFHRGLDEFWLVVAIKTAGVDSRRQIWAKDNMIMYDVDFLTTEPASIVRLHLNASSQLAVIEAPNHTR